jgi:isoaspartyl peptidase/L-asparaginase-like protein (Ntn-hydrolase superfamily)
MLVSEGAKSFAASRGLDIVVPESLVSSAAYSELQTWKTRIESYNQLSTTRGLTDIQDTVGAVALSIDGGLAAGVSRCECEIVAVLDA